MITKVLVTRSYNKGATFLWQKEFKYTLPEIHSSSVLVDLGKVVYSVFLEIPYDILKTDTQNLFKRKKAVLQDHRQGAWIVQSCETIRKNGKIMFLLTLVSLGGFVSRADVFTRYSSNSSVENIEIKDGDILDLTDYDRIKNKAAKKKAKNAVKKARKQKGVERINSVNNAMANGAVLFNPSNAKAIYNGKYASNFGSVNQHKIKKFSSYKAAILLLSDIVDRHNQKGINVINKRAFLAQCCLESNLTPEMNGRCSNLLTFGNNGAGIKCWGNEPKILSIDDDRNSHGKLIHSGFQIFNSLDEFVEKYSEITNNSRYHNAHRHTNYIQTIKDLKRFGYCSDPDYVRNCASRAKYFLKYI